MSCQAICHSTASFNNYISKHACIIQSALVIIATCGVIVSLYAVTYAIAGFLPSYAGYYGGIGALLALIVFACSTCKSCPSNYQISSKEEQALGNSRSPLDQVRGLVTEESESIECQDFSSLEDTTTYSQTFSNQVWNDSDNDLEISTGNQSLIPSLPQDVITQIFFYLNGKTLIKVSRVCRMWYRLTLNSHLWQHLCQQERVAPTEGHLTTHNYKATYYKAFSLNHRLQLTNPHRRTIHIPVSQAILDQADGSKIKFHRELLETYHNSYFKKIEFLPHENDEKTRCKGFLKIKNGYVFCHKTNDDSCYFEIWNQSLKSCLFSMPASRCTYTAFLVSMNLKIIGQRIYLYGREFTQIGPLEISGSYHIFSYDCATTKNYGTALHVKDYNKKQFEIFELGEDQAFLGRQDGTIRIWDFRVNGFGENQPTYISYWDDTVWTEQEEENWNASFGGKDIDEFYHPKAANAHCIEDMIHRRASHHVLKNRKELVGHQGAITCLRTVDECLFSSAEDGTIKQWNLANLQCIQTIETGFDRAIFMIVAGSYVFGTGTDHEHRMIRQWDLQDGTCLHEIKLQSSCDSLHVYGNLLFCLDQKYPSKELVIDVHHLSTKKVIKTLHYRSENEIAGPSDNYMQFLDHSIYILDGNSLTEWRLPELQ